MTKRPRLTYFVLIMLAMICVATVAHIVAGATTFSLELALRDGAGDKLVSDGGGRYIDHGDAGGTTPNVYSSDGNIVGDLTSVYLAIRRGVDPTPVPVIERLEAALAGS